MMFDFLVFTQYPNAHAPKRLLKEAQLVGFNISILGYGKVDLKNLPNAKAIMLREPDARKKLYKLRDEVLYFYKDKNSKILNAESYLKWSVLDKLTQHIEFKKARIPHVPVVKLGKVKYPYIAKASLGSHGSHVFKINNSKDLNYVLNKYKLKDLLFQEFQKSGFDLRVIVLGNKVLGVLKRTPKKGNFLSNYSQGGDIEKYCAKKDELQIIENISLKTAKHFKLDYVGVDLMKGNDGEWKVLEVNRACQFKGFEKATGVNVALNIINSFSI